MDNIVQSEGMAPSQAELAPVSAGERIHALDIIRGFALIGIFLMNVEWFTRSITELGSGVDIKQTGINYAASWLVYTFVQGKFWTLFSLLFGMGFAVMLGRAETVGRAFAVPYVRRIAALMLFGTAHFVMIWTGDILHNYAVTALLLLLIVTRNWKAWLATLLSVVAIGAGMLAGGGEIDSMAMTAALLGLVALLMHFIHRGSVDRYYKWGVALFSVPFMIGLIAVSVMAVAPQLKPKETPAQVAEQEKAKEERKVERAKDTAEEIRIYTRASYGESVVHRARQFREDLPDAAGLSVLALPMFLIGFWFVRTGTIVHWRENLPLFKRLATRLLPLGLAMTLVSVFMHPTHVPGTGSDPSVQFAGILFQWAMLPMSIGYFATMVCLIGTDLGSRLLSPLRYAGQMALTNYICASFAGTVFFSGYGLGYWGQVPRAGQVLFVVVVFSLQLVFSYFWLKSFRYGPLEWLWRAATYWQLPPMRRVANA